MVSLVLPIKLPPKAGLQYWTPAPCEDHLCHALPDDNTNQVPRSTALGWLERIRTMAGKSRERFDECTQESGGSDLGWGWDRPRVELG